ncbi:helix-turn-helix domain-containing protein [Spongiactinospora rosea]|uniref:helix-turn-helix domain-containing protein n=1 Tax=Spongiactinospora rosea TaxID=2248750 RepID=UPI001CED11DF|nr:helix-turn-helix transcriptional regulator [Spongiactinospora rosea]
MTAPRPWADGRLRAAWARCDWAQVFRRYRQLSGLSQMRLGELVGMPQSHVSKIENGRRRVESADVIDRITRGLQVPEELGGAARRAAGEWMPDPDLRERLARAQTSGRGDVRVADWIEHVLAEHRRAEDAVGGEDLWPVVRSQLDTVTRLIPGGSGETADRLLVLAAEHAHWLSWVASEHDRRGAAAGWLDLAHGWAIDAGNSDMAAWVLRVRAYYARTSSRDPARAERIASAAWHAAATARPITGAVAAHECAMAAAALGERDRARRLSDQAYELAQRSGDDRPGWLYWLDEVRIRLQCAEVSYAVHDWQAAANAFAEALPALNGYPRDQAYYAAQSEDAQRRL